MALIFKLLRIKHWVKNLFILLPLLFSGLLFSSPHFGSTILSAFGFSLIASCIYIINDIFDIQFDKGHPVKKYRPIPSGAISTSKALIIGVFILILGMTILWFLSRSVFFHALVYFIINVLYSKILKHLPIVDFIIVSVGFVIRILIGSEISRVELSDWTLIMVFLLSLFLAISKRRDDVCQYENENKINRSVVLHYNIDFMDKLISITSSLLLVTYLMFITSTSALSKYPDSSLLLSFLFVLIGVFRYNQITFVHNRSGSPIKILYNDRFMQLTILLWLSSFLYIIYV